MSKDFSNIKCVNIGDSGVGKTCVLVSYTENEFPDEHVPTAFDNFRSIETYDGKTINLNLWDTSGQDNDTMRPLSYQDCNVFLLFFSLVDRNSFERIKTKWVAELKQTGHHETPYLVVGNKVDLRDDPTACAQLGVNPVKKEEGEKLSKDVGAIAYLECSAKTQHGLGEVFHSAITAVIDPEKLVPAEELEKIKKKKKTCRSQ